MNKPTIYPFASKTRFAVVLVVAAEVGSKVTVYRQYGDGPVETVRGAVDVTVTRPEQLFIDYELPQGYVVTYWVVATEGSESEKSATATIGPFNFGRDMIFDLGDPKRSMLIWVENFNQYKYGISRDVQRVWGRPDPVVVSGVREMPAGTLNLLTLNLDERANLLSIIGNGSTVGFSPQKPIYGLPGVMYLAVGEVNESRVTDLARETTRRWALEVQQVAPPPAQYRFPDYGQTWRQFRESKWSVQAQRQWWEAVA